MRVGLARKIGFLDFGSCYTTKELWERVYLVARYLPHSPRTYFPSRLMKIMPNEKRRHPNAEDNVPPWNAKVTAQDPITPEDIRQHLEQLQRVSAVAAKLYTLLGKQITTVSLMAPIQRGFTSVRPNLAPVSARR